MTGTRFFAALFVMLFHFGALCPPPSWLAAILEHGRAGVSFFFVQSGFVIAYQYAGWFEAELRPSAVVGFLRARIARVYPMHVTALLLVTPIALVLLSRTPTGLMGAPIAQSTLVASWLANLFLAQIYFPRSDFEQLWNGPAWSVGTELFFYVSFPFFARAVLARLRSLRSLLALVLGCYAIEIAAFLLAASAITARYPEHRLLLLDYIPYRMPFFRVWELWIGAATGVYFVRRRPVAASNRGSRDRALLAVMMAIGIVAVATTIFGPRLPPLHWYVAYTPLFAALILLLAQGSSALSPVLEWAPIVLLGEASYSLYLLHKPMILLVRALGFDRISPGAAAALIVGCTAASVPLFRLVEMPCRRLLRGR